MLTSIFEWYMIRYRSKNEHQNKHVFKKDWIMCSQHVNHFRLSDQHDWRGGLYDHLRITIVFVLIVNQMFIRVPKTMGQMLRA